MHKKTKKATLLSVIVIVAVILGIGVVAKQAIDKKNEDFFSTAKKYKEDKTVVAVVNNDKIYQYQIDIQLAAQKLSQTNMAEACGDPTLITIRTEEEILDELIRNAVTLQEAKKQKLTAKYSDAKAYQEEQLSIVKAADDEQTRFFEQYIDEMGWTEKEYLKQVSLQWQKVMTRANLYNKFFEDNPDATDETWKKYVDSLVENADIEYK